MTRCRKIDCNDSTVCHIVKSDSKNLPRFRQNEPIARRPFRASEFANTVCGTGARRSTEQTCYLRYSRSCRSSMRRSSSSMRAMSWLRYSICCGEYSRG